MTQQPSVAPAYTFLRACRSEPVEQTPIWVMRQAGRYLPEYRALRERHSFLDVCRIPEICAEVTAQPIDRFGFDAAILFSDILIPLTGMGVAVEFDPAPRFSFRVTGREDVRRLRWEGAAQALPHVKPVVRAVKERLAGRVPLIGFAGAPFTVAAYLVDGGSSRDLARTRSFLARDPEGFSEMLSTLADATIDYLKEQIDGGADAVMLFDTQAGWLKPGDFERFATPIADRILKSMPPGTPTIYFALAPSTGHLEALRGVRAGVVGLDYRVPLRQARAILGASHGVQGNLDPAVLLGPPERIVSETESILNENGGRPGFIFNLGHGIFPDTPVDNVTLLVSIVKRYRGAGGTRP
jgi:uroporphyrinogen decarboxylase